MLQQQQPADLSQERPQLLPSRSGGGQQLGQGLVHAAQEGRDLPLGAERPDVLPAERLLQHLAQGRQKLLPGRPLLLPRRPVRQERGGRVALAGGLAVRGLQQPGDGLLVLLRHLPRPRERGRDFRLCVGLCLLWGRGTGRAPFLRVVRVIGLLAVVRGWLKRLVLRVGRGRMGMGVEAELLDLQEQLVSLGQSAQQVGALLEPLVAAQAVLPQQAAQLLHLGPQLGLARLGGGGEGGEVGVVVELELVQGEAAGLEVVQRALQREVLLLRVVQVHRQRLGRLLQLPHRLLQAAHLALGRLAAQQQLVALPAQRCLVGRELGELALQAGRLALPGRQLQLGGRAALQALALQGRVEHGALGQLRGHVALLLAQGLVDGLQLPDPQRGRVGLLGQLALHPLPLAEQLGALHKPEGEEEEEREKERGGGGGEG